MNPGWTPQSDVVLRSASGVGSGTLWGISVDVNFDANAIAPPPPAESAIYQGQVVLALGDLRVDFSYPLLKGETVFFSTSGGVVIILSYDDLIP